MQNCNQTINLPGLPAGGPITPEAQPAKPAGIWTGPRMTHGEALARAGAKRQAVMAFLASGEVWTTVDIASAVMATSRRRALPALQSMEKEGLLTGTQIDYAGRKIAIYGATAHGLAVAGNFDANPFERSAISPSHIQHHLDGQRMRLAAEAAGWQDWQPVRVMRAQAAKQGLKKVPDCIAIDPHGAPVAIEIERNCKTTKRYTEIVVAYLQEIKAKRYKYVIYICPDGLETVVQKAMERVTSVRFQGETIQINDSHRARFKFVSFSNFPGGLTNV